MISAFSTGAYYLASDVSVLLLIRLIHGAGFGLATTYFATIAAEIIPKERRGEGIGYFGVGETIAVSGGKGTVKLKVLEKRVLFPSILILFVGIAASGIMSFFSLYAIEKGFHSVGMFFFLIAGRSQFFYTAYFRQNI